MAEPGSYVEQIIGLRQAVWRRAQCDPERTIEYFRAAVAECLECRQPARHTACHTIALTLRLHSASVTLCQSSRRLIGRTQEDPTPANGT